MQKIQNIFHWTILGTVMGHMFCCGLPTIVSLISVVSSLGIIVSMPGGLIDLHDAMHNYEIGLVIMSGSMLALGWVLFVYSKKIDCHDTGCCHVPCEPKKKRSAKLLIFATFLFIVNLAVYFGIDHCVHCAHSH